jgi:hypothetical protein
MRAAIRERPAVRRRPISGPGSHASIQPVILAVEGVNGEPPYRGHWDGGHEAVLVSGPDTEVVRLPATGS